jgi:hypothetical protein
VSHSICIIHSSGSLRNILVGVNSSATTSALGTPKTGLKDLKPLCGVQVLSAGPVRLAHASRHLPPDDGRTSNVLNLLVSTLTSPVHLSRLTKGCILTCRPPLFPLIVTSPIRGEAFGEGAAHFATLCRGLSVIAARFLDKLCSRKHP